MKKYSFLFIAACLILCLIPSVGMLFFPTTETTENKAMAAAPALVTPDGYLNTDFISDFEDYFTQRVALRNQMVYADAKIQTGLFQESNVSGVIRGTDGWLYYSSTLDDYLGTGLLSERELYNLAHNFSVVQDYLQQRNMDFVLTIAPNKNTLYGEHMPYYKSYVVNTDHNALLLAPYLADLDVAYLDLFTLFSQQEETLYLRTDSHWNNKGACMVYNGMMDMLELPHEDYSDVTPTPFYNEHCDLNRMLFSFYGEPELDYAYDLAHPYTYANHADSVEDGWIVTENESGSGTLLMFRDSFANTLIPFLSGEFQTACYSKGEPNALERYAETYAPDCVVIQKVERNIANYLHQPPIITPPLAALPADITIAKTSTTLQAEPCMNDANYYKFTGTLDNARMQTASEVVVRVNGTLYRAYQTGTDGFTFYLKTAEFSQNTADVQVYIVNGNTCLQVLAAKIDLPQV